MDKRTYIYSANTRQTLRTALKPWIVLYSILLLFFLFGAIIMQQVWLISVDFENKALLRVNGIGDVKRAITPNTQHEFLSETDPRIIMHVAGLSDEFCIYTNWLQLMNRISPPYVLRSLYQIDLKQAAARTNKELSIPELSIQGAPSYQDSVYALKLNQKISWLLLYVFIPVFCGCFGATLFVLKKISSQLRMTEQITSAHGRKFDFLRLVLGGVCGVVISGVFFLLPQILLLIPKNIIALFPEFSIAEIGQSLFAVAVAAGYETEILFRLKKHWGTRFKRQLT